MVRQSAEASDCEGLALRVSAQVVEGEVRYQMGFDQARAGDTVWECHGVSILVREEEEKVLLDNVILDFQDLPRTGPQFTFLALKPGEEAPARLH